MGRIETGTDGGGRSGVSLNVLQQVRAGVVDGCGWLWMVMMVMEEVVETCSVQKENPIMMFGGGAW